MRGNPVRKQVLIVAAVGLVIAVGAVGWYMLTPCRVGSLIAEGERTNLLGIVYEETGEAEAMAVFSLSSADVAMLALPVGLGVKTPGGGVETAAGVFATEGGTGAAAAIGELLGVDVPFHVTIARGTLAEWIDAAGGVSLLVEETVAYEDRSVEPPVQVEIRPGELSMSGEEAVAFALSPGLSRDIGRVRRQQLVLGSWGGEAGVGDVAALRAAIRTDYRSIATDCALQDLLQIVDLVAELPAEAVRAAVVPTETMTVGGEARIVPRIVETERLIASALKGIDLLTPDEVAVAVFNGNGVRNMARRTAEYLQARGFTVTQVGNADSFQYAPSYIVVLTDEAKAWLLQDALPPNEIRIVSPETFEGDYDVLREYVPLGTDVLLIAGLGMVVE